MFKNLNNNLNIIVSFLFVMFIVGIVSLDSAPISQNGTAGGMVGGTDFNIITIEIGDWDMDADLTVSVTHNLADSSKVRYVQTLIRDDADTFLIPLTFVLSNSTHTAGGMSTLTSTVINIHRVLGQTFDSTEYNATSFNRGFITFISIN